MIIDGKEYNASYKRNSDYDWMKYVPEKLRYFEEKNKICIRIRNKETDKLSNYVSDKLKRAKEISLDNFRDELLSITEVPIIFNLFELNFNKCRAYVIKCDSSEEGFEISLVSKNREIVYFYVIAEKNGCNYIYAERNEDTEKDIDNYIFYVKNLMSYILSHSKKIIYNKKPEKTLKVQNSEKNNGKTNEIRIEDAVCYVSDHFPMLNSRKIMKECYGVRGHYRHYKDGKIVFIKPYKKGINRDSGNMSEQNYVI